MKVVIERDALRDALAVVVPRAKNSIDAPIFSHLLVEVGTDFVRVTGHDLDSCSTVDIPAETQGAGAAAIPADRFNRLVSGLPAGAQIELQIAGNRAIVRSGRSRYEMSLLPADLFPKVLAPDDAIEFTLTAQQVARLFKTPASCISKDESRIYLQGIYLHAAGGLLSAVATNGVALIFASVPVKADAFDGVIVPKRSCDEIVRISGGESVVISISRTLVGIRSANRRFVTKLIDGTFPDYERVIPEICGTPVTAEVDALEAALSRLLVVTDDTKKDAKSAASKPAIVKFEWDAAQQQLTADFGTGIGSGREVIDCDCPEQAQPGHVGLQPTYLREVLEGLGGSRVCMHIAGAAETLRFVNPDDPDLVAICMPYQL